MRTITVPDGYRGATVTLDADDILDETTNSLKLHVVGFPHLVRWVWADEYHRQLVEQS